MAAFKKLSRILFLVIPVLIIAKSVIAETRAAVTPENQASISDDGLGVQLRFDKNGELLSVKSTYHHPVEFPDRRGISKAYIIAEEKAKANIARFMNQVISTSRITNELDESQSQSNRNRSNNGESWSKDNSRKVTESLREVTTSSSSAILKGVRILERSYNEKDEEVLVVVGINRESQLGSQQLQSGLAKPSDDNRIDRNSNSGSDKASGFPSLGSEKRRSTDLDKF